MIVHLSFCKWGCSQVIRKQGLISSKTICRWGMFIKFRLRTGDFQQKTPINAGFSLSGLITRVFIPKHPVYLEIFSSPSMIVALFQRGGPHALFNTQPCHYDKTIQKSWVNGGPTHCLTRNGSGPPAITSLVRGESSRGMALTNSLAAQHGDTTCRGERICYSLSQGGISSIAMAKPKQLEPATPRLLNDARLGLAKFPFRPEPPKTVCNSNKMSITWRWAEIAIFMHEISIFFLLCDIHDFPIYIYIIH